MLLPPVTAAATTPKAFGAAAEISIEKIAGMKDRGDNLENIAGVSDRG